MDMGKFSALLQESAARGDDLEVDLTHNAAQFAEFVLKTVRDDEKRVVNASIIHRMSTPQHITYSITVQLPENQ